MKVTQKPGQGRLISFRLSLLLPDLIFEVTFKAIVQMCAVEPRWNGCFLERVER